MIWNTWDEFREFRDNYCRDGPLKETALGVFTCGIICEECGPFKCPHRDDITKSEGACEDIWNRL